VDLQSENGRAFEPKDESGLDPFEIVAINERAIIARELLDNLREKCSEILRLRFDEDLKYKEIQKRLGIPLGTVCKRISDCLERARGMIKDFDVGME
jgi:RNA polymerase sigma factor (sigma-70 family)